MRNIDILLIIVCGAGLVHGLIISIYLGIIKNKRTISDIFLSVLLILMAFRIGKSILFQFNHNLEFLFIFLGLSTLLLIGPLLNWYVKSILNSKFKLFRKDYLQAIPFVLILFISFFLTKQWFIENGKYWIYIFLLGIYLHLAFYLFISFKRVYVFNQSFISQQKTKSQDNILRWLYYVVVGMALVWISYVLNIFEEQIPYIIGPLIYTVCIYFLTFKAFKLKINDIDSKSFEILNESSNIYKIIIALMENEQFYLSSNVTLNKLAELTGFSSHKISLSINEYSKMNYNNFINYYRVQMAKKILKEENSIKTTIASIAYDVGFNNLSSFNTAFKKIEKTTPSAYRDSINLH